MGVQSPGRPGPVGDPGVVRPGPQPGEADHDARSAKPALAPSGRTERLGPRRADLGVQTVEGGHRPSVDPAGRGYARDSGLVVDQHRAATALALGAAPILDRPDADPVPKDVEQRSTVVGNLDVDTVDGEVHHVGRPGSLHPRSVPRGPSPN